MEGKINQKINQDEVLVKEEKRKKWGVGSYIMLALFLGLYSSQIENFEKDWGIIIEALLAGIISSFLFYPVFNRSKIKNKQLKAFATGLFLYVAIGTIVKLLIMFIVLQANGF